MCRAEQGNSTQRRDVGNNPRDIVTFYIDGITGATKRILVPSILVTREVIAF